jgi:lipopolysaccharide cholinephosphotransferase
MKKLELDEIKQIELDILKACASFCEDNNLRYSLSYGTLLGCVRHRGFIPWDDDIDIVMPRADYDKLISLKQKFEDKNSYLRFRTLGDKRYPYPFLKVIDTSTLVNEKEMESRYQTSLWIDVFPLDTVSGDERKHKSNVRTIDFWQKILVKSIIKSSNIGQSTLSRMLNSLILIPIAHLIGMVLNIPKICEDKAKKFVSANDAIVTNYVWENSPRKYVLEIRKVFPASKGYFEGIEFNIPNDSDYCLKLFYGDYMKLPPETERVSHLVDAWKIK